MAFDYGRLAALLQNIQDPGLALITHDGGPFNSVISHLTTFSDVQGHCNYRIPRYILHNTCLLHLMHRVPIKMSGTFFLMGHGVYATRTTKTLKLLPRTANINRVTVTPSLL